MLISELNFFLFLLESEILFGHPSSCGQSEGPWWKGHRPGHRDGDGPAVHDGRDCWGGLLLCCGGTGGRLLTVAWTLKRTHILTFQFTSSLRVFFIKHDKIPCVGKFQQTKPQPTTNGAGCASTEVGYQGRNLMFVVQSGGSDALVLLWIPKSLRSLSTKIPRYWNRTLFLRSFVVAVYGVWWFIVRPLRLFPKGASARWPPDVVCFARFLSPWPRRHSASWRRTASLRRSRSLINTQRKSL